MRPHTRLLRNRGTAAPGTFEDVTAASGALTTTRSCLEGGDRCSQHAFASAFSDLDGDGWDDLVVVSDFGRTRLFSNLGDGTFALGIATGTIGGDENGMGSTIGDWDGDGDLDWFVSSIFDAASTCALSPCTWGASGNRLYRNVAGAIEDATDAAGVRDAGWGWGAAFFDADSDGDLDLVAANGIAFPDVPYDDVFAADRMRFWSNDAGRMTESSAIAGLDAVAQGRGVLVFDYDADGDLDLFVAVNGGRPFLLRNDSPPASWLRVVPRPRSGAADALGARVTVLVRPGDRELVREVASSSHFLAQSERVAHFGLGEGVATVAEVRVRWASGRASVLADVAAGQVLLVPEPP
jgi:hypothetical protein